MDRIVPIRLLYYDLLIWRAAVTLSGMFQVSRWQAADVIAEVRPRLALYSGANSREVAALLSYLNEHLFDPALSVKTLKARCQLRDNNVSCRFKLETGVYLHAYITSRRLDAAAILLCESRLSIAETAGAVGYQHLQTFYRAFKEQFGCTPATFRSQSRLRVDRGGLP